MLEENKDQNLHHWMENLTEIKLWDIFLEKLQD